VSRRDFIKLSAVVAAGAGLAACEPAGNTPEQPGVVSENLSNAAQYPEVPVAPSVPPPPTLVTLTAEQARTIDALVSRIYPGDASDPGAHEAGVVNFIDKMLAFHEGGVQPYYGEGPHAKAYEGDTPPSQTSDKLGPIIWVKKSELHRYGTQSTLKLLDRYRNGVGYVNAYSKSKYGNAFADLPSNQQDQVIQDMINDKAKDFFEDPSDMAFFGMLQTHTIQGMFSDPAYGGNEAMVGWKQIGYPGAQRAFTPEDMNTEGPVRPQQSLAMLHAFHGGMKSNASVIAPQSGSTEVTPEP
jgi:gluconate 2-dehydrogenase gamma chain